jgi:hypothetical protein
MLGPLEGENPALCPGLCLFTFGCGLGGLAGGVDAGERNEETGSMPRSDVHFDLEKHGLSLLLVVFVGFIGAQGVQ